MIVLRGREELEASELEIGRHQVEVHDRIQRWVPTRDPGGVYEFREEVLVTSQRKGRCWSHPIGEALATMAPGEILLRINAKPQSMTGEREAALARRVEYTVDSFQPPDGASTERIRNNIYLASAAFLWDVVCRLRIDKDREDRVSRLHGRLCGVTHAYWPVTAELVGMLLAQRELPDVNEAMWKAIVEGKAGWRMKLAVHTLVSGGSRGEA